MDIRMNRFILNILISMQFLSEQAKRPDGGGKSCRVFDFVLFVCCQTPFRIASASCTYDRRRSGLPPIHQISGRAESRPLTRSRRILLPWLVVTITTNIARSVSPADLMRHIEVSIRGLRAVMSRYAVVYPYYRRESGIVLTEIVTGISGLSFKRETKGVCTSVIAELRRMLIQGYEHGTRSVDGPCRNRISLCPRLPPKRYRPRAPIC